MVQRTTKPDGEQGSSRLYSDAALGEVLRRCLRLEGDELADILDLLRQHQHEPELHVVDDPPLRVVGASDNTSDAPADLDFPDKPEESLQEVQGQIVGLAIIRHKMRSLYDDLEHVMPGWVGKLKGTPEQRNGWIAPLNHMQNAGDEMLTAEDSLCASIA